MSSTIRNVLVLGVVVTLMSNAGTLAVFTDRATTGDNSATSGEFNGGGGGTGPSGLEIADAALDPDAGSVLCGDFVDDLTTGLFAMADVQPGATETAYACLRNEASVPLSILTSAIDLVDSETSCSPGEAEAGDATCGIGAGELSAVLVIALSTVDCASRNPIASVETTLADLGGPSRSLGDPLDPNGVECVQISTSYPAQTDEVLAQVAQTDQASWRAAFDGIEAAGPPAEWLLMWGAFGSENDQFRYPQGVAINASGNVFIADNENHRIQEFTADGVYVGTIGSFGYEPGQLRYPEGLAIDAAGNLYVADTSNDRIQVFDASGQLVVAWGSQGTGDGQLRAPADVALDGAGHAYVADSFNNRIEEFTAGGVFVASWGGQGSGDGQFENPTGIAIDGTGSVYVADTFNHRIQKFTAAGQFVASWGTLGSGDGQLHNPGRLRLDASGNVVVPDQGNDRIELFSSTGDFIRVLGGTPQGDAAGDFYGPLAVGVAPSGRLYVADTHNHRVQAFLLQ